MDRPATSHKEKLALAELALFALVVVALILTPVAGLGADVAMPDAWLALTS